MPSEKIDHPDQVSAFAAKAPIIGCPAVLSSETLTKDSDGVVGGIQTSTGGEVGMPVGIGSSDGVVGEPPELPGFDFVRRVAFVDLSS